MKIRTISLAVTVFSIVLTLSSILNLSVLQNNKSAEIEQLRVATERNQNELRSEFNTLREEVHVIKDILLTPSPQEHERVDQPIPQESPNDTPTPTPTPNHSKSNRENPYKDVTKRPLYPPEWEGPLLQLKEQTKGDCRHTIHRDYNTDPVQHSGKEGAFQCAVPCVKGSADIAARAQGVCPHTKSFEFTMENRGTSVGGLSHIAGNTHLNSDVIIQYFSWAEYDFMQEPKPKTASAPLAAFISNCGPQYRLNYLEDLMKAGLNVHSYGRCKNNMPEPRTKEDNHHNKQDLAASYKFIMSFENSETDDYVTEKMFQPLVAGSVPVYHGAPNAKKFVPNDHSVIFASDFESPAALASYLKYLDSNDTAYNEYLSWKYEGSSKEWIALVDISIIHSECRFCVRSADIDRLVVGEVVTGPFEDENKVEMQKYQGSDALMLKVRERSEFWLRRIHLVDLTFDELKRAILEKWNDSTKGEIIWIYELWDREKVLIDSDLRVNQLQYGHEIEVVFENPASKDRGSYSKWYEEKSVKCNEKVV